MPDVLSRIRDIASQVAYKEGWIVEVEGDDGDIRIRVKTTEITPVPWDPPIEELVMWYSLEELCPVDPTDDQLVEALFTAIARTEVHEAQEWFRYRGEVWRHPHKESIRKISS